MKRFALIGLLLLAACASPSTGPRISASLLTTYDAAVSAEIAALSTGKVSPSEATNLRACRVAANRSIQAVVAAENAGTSTTDVGNTAQNTVSSYLNAAQTLTSCASVIGAA